MMKTTKKLKYRSSVTTAELAVIEIFGLTINVRRCLNVIKMAKNRIFFHNRSFFLWKLFFGCLLVSLALLIPFWIHPLNIQIVFLFFIYDLSLICFFPTQEKVHIGFGFVAFLSQV